MLTQSARPSRSRAPPEADRIGVRAERRHRLASQRHAAPGVAGQPGRLGGSPEQVDPIDPGESLRVVDHGPGLERTFVVASRVGECERARGRFACPDRRLERSPLVACRRPVIRKLAPVPSGDRATARATLRQRFREGTVESLAFARQEVVVGGLLEQCVAEFVVARRVVRGRTRDEDLAAHGFPETVEQIGIGESRDVGEQVVIDPATSDRGDTDDGLGAFGQCDDPGQQDLPEGRWQTATIGLAAGAEQLLDEERVAVRPPVDLVDKLRRRRCVEDRSQELSGRSESSRSTSTRSTCAAPVEFREPRQQRMAPMQLVGPEGHDQDHPVGPKLADEERDRLARGWVGPMEVLDHEDDGFDLGQTLEDAEDRVEEPRLERLGLRSRVLDPVRRQRRHESCEVVTSAADDDIEAVRVERPHQCPERLDDRAVGNAAMTDISAATDEDAHPARCRQGRRLGDQAGLADAGLARDELMDRGARDGTVECAGDRCELRRPAHERRADQAAWHALMIRVDHRATGLRWPQMAAPRRITRNQQATRPTRSRQPVERTRGGLARASEPDRLEVTSSILRALLDHQVRGVEVHVHRSVGALVRSRCRSQDWGSRAAMPSGGRTRVR